MNRRQSLQPLVGNPGLCRLGVLALAICCFVAVPVAPARAADENETQRQRIAIERTQADSVLSQRRWECSQRFAVTACMDKARAAYRESVDRLNREEEEIDGRLRHERAARRLQIIGEKTDALARLPSSAALPSAPAQPQPATRRSAGVDAAESAQLEARREAERAASERAAAQRAADSQQRREEAARRRAERESQRTQAKQPSPGLPARPPIPPARAPASSPN